MLDADVTGHCTNKLFYCNLTHFLLNLIIINGKITQTDSEAKHQFPQLGPPAKDMHSCLDLYLCLQLTNSNDSYANGLHLSAHAEKEICYFQCDLSSLFP